MPKIKPPLFSAEAPLVEVESLPNPNAVIVSAGGKTPEPTTKSAKLVSGAKMGFSYTKTHDITIHLYESNADRQRGATKPACALYVEHSIAGVSTLYRCNHEPIADMALYLVHLPEKLLHAAITMMIATLKHAESTTASELLTSLYESIEADTLKIRKRRNKEGKKVVFRPFPLESSVEQTPCGAFTGTVRGRVFDEAHAFTFPKRQSREHAHQDLDNRLQNASYVSWEIGYNKRGVEVKPSPKTATRVTSQRKPSQTSIFPAFR